MTRRQKGPRIVVVGSVNADLVVKTGRLPRPGETVLGGEFRVASGGKGANQAVAAARAGGRVAFIARVGNDRFGTGAISGFKDDGIETKHIRISRAQPTGVALIVVDRRGENSIAVASGANLDLSPADIRRAAGEIRGAEGLLLQLESPLDTVVEAARTAARAGVPVILNPAPAPDSLLPPGLLALVDILTPNADEAARLSGVGLSGRDGIRKAARILLNKMTARASGRRSSGPAVLITLGPKGVLIAAPGMEIAVPAFKVRAVDTTAAGDVFNGALAAALAEKRHLLDAVRFAAAAAAVSVTRMGAQPSAPRRYEILQIMKTDERENI
ncbi:MAG: ribokinase [Candidatus Aminicenantes bacterium]|nr:ribokinase [Candidatus Aminicenantes bacterium]